MQTQIRFTSGQQMELSERVIFGSDSIPRERPTADAELEETFVRAAIAWARWRERRRWVTAR